MAEAKESNWSAHISTIMRIYRILDGAEWSPSTIEEVAQAITDLGYEIHGPEDAPSTWELSATIDIKMVGTEVESLTVHPNQSADAFVLWEGNVDFIQDDVNEALARYLGATEHTRNGQTVHQLGWEG